MDVGCANGKLLAMLNDKKKIVGSGLDISSEMIKVAKAQYPNFTFEQGSAQEIPFNNESFDLIICSASFHHFPKPERFLIKAECLLRPNGRLVIAEIHIPFITKIYNWWINRFSTEGDVKVYQPKELTELFNQNGWKINKKRFFYRFNIMNLKKITDRLLLELIDKSVSNSKIRIRKNYGTRTTSQF